MSERSQAAGRKRKAPDGDADRLSELPEGLLLYILSFLPSHDAVQTCVLARRWRNLWKSVPALRITPNTTSWYSNANALNGFVNHLLLSRNRSPLHVAEFNSVAEFDSYEHGDFDEAVQYFELWVRYSLSCQVTKLFVTNHLVQDYWFLPMGLITSEHLTTLELFRAKTEHDLDFSSCVSLKDLKMDFSTISCDRIVSPSLKRLTIAQSSFLLDVRTQISAPNLILLLLVDCWGRTPLLMSMPYLVEAFVRLADCEDICKNCYEIGDCGDVSCWGCCPCENDYGKNTCILLQGLSSCTNLELTATKDPFIFRKDLVQCPVFSRLKTLLLNDWWVSNNLGALICFLQHSPVLEKLTLQFESPKYQIHEKFVEIGASYNLSMQPLELKDLNVEVKCCDGDEQVHKVLDVLGSYGLRPEKIKIQQSPKVTRAQFAETWPAGSFSFEQAI